MKRKVVSLFLAMVLSISCAIPAMAADTALKESDNTHSISLEKESSLYTAGEFLWKAAFKLAKWALIKGDNALFYRDPQIIDLGGNWVASSSGSVSFGNGSNNARRVKFTTNVSTAHNYLDVFAQTGITGWLETITIFIEDSSGDEVYGGQVTHNQHIFTDFDLPLSTYSTYYVYSGNRKWDCWIYRYDFTDYHEKGVTPSDVTNSIMLYNSDMRKSYLIPSDIFSPKSKVTRNGNNLTAQDLVDQFYDDQLNCSVNRMKNYDIGDTIYVIDVITDLKYDKDTNVTTLYFGDTTDGSFAWPFAGDLRNQFNLKDELTFKFKVVEEYASGNYSFETLDYFLESYGLIAEGTAADIEDYLVK